MTLELETALGDYLAVVQQEHAAIGTKPRAPSELASWTEWSLARFLDQLERRSEFATLVQASDREYPENVSGLTIKDATRLDLKTFLRLSGLYQCALDGLPVKAQEAAGRYRSAMSATEHTLTYLVPIEGAEFSEDHIDCGGFEICRFSREELDTITSNLVRKAFFASGSHIDSQTLADYWFVQVKNTVPRERDLDTILFDLKVQVTYSNYPRAVEEALRRLALFNWHKVELYGEQGPVTEPANSFGPSLPRLPFAIICSDSLIERPSTGPDLSVLETEPNFDLQTGAEIGWRPHTCLRLDEAKTREFEEFIRRTGELMSKLTTLRGEGKFLEVAMGFLLKACVTAGMEQLLWNIAAIEGAVGEKGPGVTERLLRRVSRICGTDEKDRKNVRKTFDELYAFRSNLVHAKSDLPDKDVYRGHLRQARNLARGVVCWMLNYLGQVSDVIPSSAAKIPHREDLLKLLDLDMKPSSRSQISAVLGSLPPEFPLAAGWLMD